MPVFKHHVIVADSAQELEVALDQEGDYESLGTVMIDGKPAVITRHRVLGRLSPFLTTVGPAEGSLPSY